MQLTPKRAALESSSDLDLVSDRNIKTGWSRKRKIWTIAGGIAVIVVVVVAVVVPIKLKENRAPSFTYQELYFPQGLNGTGLNGALGGRRTNTTYDQLLVYEERLLRFVLQVLTSVMQFRLFIL
jgi:hypothetical protein